MIDPSIPLQVQPPKFNNPFEVLGQYRQLQQQRDEAEQRKKLIAQQIASNQALEEDRRQKLEAEHRQQAELDQVNALISAPDFSIPTFLEQVRVKVPGQYAALKEQYDKQQKAAADAKLVVENAKKAHADVVAAMNKYLGQKANVIAADGYSPTSFLLHAQDVKEQFPEMGPQIDEVITRVRSGEPIRSVVDPLRELDQSTTESLTKRPTITPNADGLTPDQAARIEIDRDRLKVDQGNLQARVREGTEKPKVTPNEALSATMRLRNDFRTETKAAQEVTRQYELMKSALQSVKDGRAAAGSQGVLVTFQKILDPTSVVRESEYARSAAGQSFLSQLQGRLDRIAQGGAGVPVSELENFVKTAEQFAAKQREYASVASKQIEGIATRYGLAPEDIVRDLDMPAAGASSSASVPDLSGLPPGKGRQFSSGPFAGQTWTIGPDGQPKRVK